MEEGKKKFALPKEPIALGVMISAVVFVVLSLVNMIIYYFGKHDPKISSPTFTFFAVFFLSFIVLYSVYKGKTLLGTILFLLTLIVERGLGFIRGLFFDDISLSSFADFFEFFTFGLLVWLVIAIILLYKKERPNLKFSAPQRYLLPFFVIGYGLIFSGFTNTLMVTLIFIVFILFDEMDLIGWFISARFILGISSIIDFFIFKNKYSSYEEPFGFWLSNIIEIALFVLGMIAIFKPELFVLRAKSPTATPESGEESQTTTKIQFEFDEETESDTFED